jgi:steroid 5-alpha reductase family enzyme
VKHKFWIDTHKGANALAILALIAAYGAWHDTTAWLYLALHGTYGILWVTKSRVFPDKQWELPVSLGYGLFTWAGLSLYWISPWLIVSGRARPMPAWYLALAVSIYTFGIFLHFASDMQKHMHLQLRPGTLLTDGLWARVRNPNYLGELLVYGGFSMLPAHWAPALVMAAVILGGWIPFMLRKDRSLARYPEFAAWKSRSKLLLPGIW